MIAKKPAQLGRFFRSGPERVLKNGSRENEKLLFHGGMLNGYSNSMGFLPEHDIGIIILANSNTPISGFLMARFFDEFLNLPLKDYSTLNLKEYIRW